MAEASDHEGAAELTRWTIHGERMVDQSRRMDVSIASVQLPDGVMFEQYVLRMPSGLDDPESVNTHRRTP